MNRFYQSDVDSNAGIHHGSLQEVERVAERSGDSDQVIGYLIDSF